MSTVTYDAVPAEAAARPAEAPVRKSLFARAFNALIDAQMRRAEDEVARYRHLAPGGFSWVPRDPKAN